MSNNSTHVDKLMWGSVVLLLVTWVSGGTDLFTLIELISSRVAKKNIEVNINLLVMYKFDQDTLIYTVYSVLKIRLRWALLIYINTCSMW